MEETAIKDFRVLVVDDEKMIRHLIGTVLERYHIKSDFAENGQSAFEKWKSVYYHAIMMDINMPVMDGFEVVKQIRKEERETDRPYTPVIALTSLELQNGSMKRATKRWRTCYCKLLPTTCKPNFFLGFGFINSFGYFSKTAKSNGFCY